MELLILRPQNDTNPPSTLAIENNKAIELSSKGVWVFSKEKSLEYIKSYDITPKCKSCYERFGQIWSKATVLSRLNNDLLFEWYKNKYSDVYNEIVE